MRLLFLVFILGCQLASFSQAIEEDQILYRYNFAFEKGIYLKYSEFQQNKPLFIKPFERSGTTIKTFNDSANKLLPVNPNRVWGYTDGQQVYVAYEDAFWKILNIGKLNHFTAIIVTEYTTVDAFGFPVQRYTKTLNHLFFDFDTGIVQVLNKKNIKPYLENGVVKFKNMKLKNTEDLILALQSINRVNPIYFPKHE